MEKPDPQDIFEHPDAVRNEVHLGSLLVDPICRDLGQGDGKPLGQVEDLDIECESVDLLSGKQLLDHLSSEHLKATLGVRNPIDQSYVATPAETCFSKSILVCGLKI